MSLPTETVSAPTTASPLLETFVALCAIRSEARAEQDVAEWVRNYARRLGLSWEEDDAGEALPAGCGNILVRLPGTVEGTPIFLCSHLDTVVVDGDLRPEVRDGRVTNAAEAILGSDNKAAVAVMLELLRELAAGDVPHAGVEVLFTPCEEIGLLGAKHFDSSRLQARFGYVFDHADDIGKIVSAAPSQVSLRVTFTGVAAHSGIAPEAGVSAVLAAADALSRMHLGRIDEQTTTNIGLIHGGTARNIVPETCVLEGEARSLDPQQVPGVVEQMLKACTDAATAHGVDVDVDVHDEYRAYSFSRSSPPVKLAWAALEREGYAPELVPCGGGSDGNIFNERGKPCVNLCNGMRRIHTSDEYIDVDDLEGMLRVARSLVRLARADADDAL